MIIMYFISDIISVLPLNENVYVTQVSSEFSRISLNHHAVVFFAFLKPLHTVAINQFSKASWKSE